jgi:tetratricopeptide (TPR) repeat protein
MSSSVPRLRGFLLALAAVSALLAQDPGQAERLYLAGERAYAVKSYQEALDTWAQVVQSAPKSAFAAQALLSMARYQVEVAHQPEAALPWLDRIKAEHLDTPWAAEALLMRGRILAARRRPQDLKEAMGEFNRVLDLFPDHPCVQEVRLELGNSFRLLDQWGRALQSYLEAVRLDPATAAARSAQLEAAETLDLMGDTTGCLRMLQYLRDRAPQSAEARDAEWRIQVRVKERIQKPPLRSQGPWPDGRQKWLKTPTLLAIGPGGGLFLYQDDLDQAFRLKDGQLIPAGPPTRAAKALVATPAGQVWLVTSRQGVVREGAPPIAGVPPLQAPTGAALDPWGNLWLSDAKAPSLLVVPPEGPARAVPLAGAAGLAALPGGGMVAASDAAHALVFLDPQGQVRFTVPYGKDLPAPFKSVLALAADPLGHVAALVEGDFDGVAVWGPDGALLRSATFKSLGLAGRFRAIAMDRQGGLILADRSNDQLIRLD